MISPRVFRASRMSVIALLFAAAHLSAAPTAIVGVTVVDPSKDDAHAAMKDATVVFDGDRVVAVGPSASVKVPKDATRIDGTGHWLIPGLTDGHVHFFQSGNLYTRPDVADFNAVVPEVCSQWWLPWLSKRRFGWTLEEKRTTALVLEI